MLHLICVASGLLLAPLRVATPTTSFSAVRASRARSAPVAALDYKDPSVAEEFANIQVLDIDAVEEELAASGIVASPAMNEMDIRLMLVETRLRKSGKLGTKKKTEDRPKSFANAFERALYEKPAFKELYEQYRKTMNVNAINLATEYLTNPKLAAERYGGTPLYTKTVAEIEAALNAKVEQVRPSLRHHDPLCVLHQPLAASFAAMCVFHRAARFLHAPMSSGFLSLMRRL